MVARLLPRTFVSGFFVMSAEMSQNQNPTGLKKTESHRFILLLFTLLVTIVGWEALIQISDFPAFILPGPGVVFESFIGSLASGILIRHSLVTLSEVLFGLALGLSAATLLGYALAKSAALERIISPYIVASQAIPLVAIAPLLVIWFGPGSFSKVLICALIVFFPVLINTIVGLRSVPEDLRDLMRSLHSTHWQTFQLLEMPAALPIFLGGLRIGATLAVIGAVVGEFVGADQGLGFLINRARGQYDTALVFVAVFSLVLMALGLYGVVIYLEHRLLTWQEKEK